MKDLDSHWNWGPAFRALRDDVNLLAWLLAEEKNDPDEPGGVQPPAESPTDHPEFTTEEPLDPST